MEESDRFFSSRLNDTTQLRQDGRSGKRTIALTRLQLLLELPQRIPSTQMIREPKELRVEEPLVEKPRYRRPQPQLLALVRCPLRDPQ